MDKVQMRQEAEKLTGAARPLVLGLIEEMEHQSQAILSMTSDRDPKFASLRQGLEAIQESLSSQTSLLTYLSSQVAAQQAEPQDILPPHPIGLCQDTSCEVCVAQGHELVKVGQEYALAAYADEIDEALRLAAGDAIRNRVAQLVQQGSALRVQRAQVVEIVP